MGWWWMYFFWILVWFLILSLTAVLSAFDTLYLTFIFTSHPCSVFSKRTVYLQSFLLVMFFILQPLLLRCFLCATIHITVCLFCCHIAHICKILKHCTWLFHHSVNKTLTVADYTILVYLYWGVRQTNMNYILINTLMISECFRSLLCLHNS